MKNGNKETIRQLIMMSTGITQEDMFWLEVECGIEYIKQQCDGDIKGYEWLINSRDIFWNWWVNNWAARNQEFALYWKLDWSIELSASDKIEFRRQYKAHHWRGFNSNELYHGYWQAVKRGMSEPLVIKRKEVTSEQ